jgi:hypothetical protein
VSFLHDLGKKLAKVLLKPIFSATMEGFALQKAWLSAQSEALQVVCGVNDGSKTDSFGCLWWLGEYKLGIFK